MKKVTIRKELPVTLTQVELMAYSKDIAKNCQDKTKAEGAKKEAVADFNARIARFDAEINALSTKISNGYEYREVKCEWDYLWDSGVKILFRTDTFQEIDRQPIESYERQEELFDGKEETQEPTPTGIPADPDTGNPVTENDCQNDLQNIPQNIPTPLWQMTREERFAYACDMFPSVPITREHCAAMHCQEIRAALAEGKPVPGEVLACYAEFEGVAE